jgi:hypothetical protein
MILRICSTTWLGSKGFAKNGVSKSSLGMCSRREPNKKVQGNKDVIFNNQDAPLCHETSRSGNTTDAAYFGSVSGTSGPTCWPI